MGQIFQLEVSGGLTAGLTVSAETTLSTVEFLNDFVHQGNGDLNIEPHEFVAGLADVFVPYYGDSWWENLIDGVASFIPVIPIDTLVDITRTDTVIGILVHAPSVTVTVSAGTHLEAGASLGLGGELPIAPAINVGASVSAGVTISAGIDVDPILSRTFDNDWRPVNPA